MAASDFSDLYILYKGHPRYDSSKIIEDDVIAVILQKWQMICFTNKGDLFFQPEFGGNLQYYLHETRLSETSIREDLNQQIQVYIPELSTLPYTLEVNIFEDPERYQEWMEIYLQISEYEIIINVR